MPGDWTEFPRTEQDWEACWAPYDPATYQAVLACIHPEDHVLEIGAGDFRLARQIAAVARQVTGIEIQAPLVARALYTQARRPLPNLTLLQGDARSLPFPYGITTGVLLMRHCTHFRFYAEKLKRLGCTRLVTNARWRMGVEEVDLFAPRQDYLSIRIGWYACFCGKTGFITGPLENLTPELETLVHEVAACPACSPQLEARQAG